VKKLQILLILVLLVAVVSVYRHLNEIKNDENILAVSSAQKAESVANAKALNKTVESKETKNFSDMIEKEAASVSQLNDRPEEVEQRLKDLAARMKDEDVSVLQEKALNTNLNGDERFLSVYILGESSLGKAQESLERIAETPLPKMQDSRLMNQEEILRGQAIESLREPESIKRVLTRADNKFLADRAQRTLLYREGKISASPETQDQQALTKLLEKSTQ